MAIEFPSILNMGPYDVEVVDMSQNEAEAQSLRGRHMPPRQRIEIWTGQEDGQKVETLIHEAMHVMWKIVDLPGGEEESVISRLAPQVVQLFRLNPKLRDVLFVP